MSYCISYQDCNQSLVVRFVIMIFWCWPKLDTVYRLWVHQHTVKSSLKNCACLFFPPACLRGLCRKLLFSFLGAKIVTSSLGGAPSNCLLYPSKLPWIILEPYFLSRKKVDAARPSWLSSFRDTESDTFQGFLVPSAVEPYLRTKCTRFGHMLDHPTW